MTDQEGFTQTAGIPEGTARTANKTAVPSVIEANTGKGAVEAAIASKDAGAWFEEPVLTALAEMSLNGEASTFERAMSAAKRCVASYARFTAEVRRHADELKKSRREAAALKDPPELKSTDANDLGIDEAINDGINAATSALEDLRARARTATIDEIQNLLQEIAAADLSRAECDAILSDIKASTGATMKALRGDLVGLLKEMGVIGGDQDTVSSTLINLALSAGMDLWHDPDKNPWATIKFEDRIEHHPLKTKAIRRYLQRLYFMSTGGEDGGKGKAAGSEAMQSALCVLEAKAVFNGEVRKPFIRVAETGGAIFLDLCNDRWEVVRITADGWNILQAAECPVRFKRARGMLALPYPVNDTIRDIDLLAPLINIDTNTREWRLIVGWLLALVRGNIPYPVLVQNGEQGSGKSTSGRLLRSIIDPNTSPLRKTPKEDRDLLISATNSWVQGFDNISGLPEWLSDALCRLATGGGLATRELYTDDEEMIFDAKRPVLLNGITDFVTRPDLIDRSILVEYSEIPDENRKTEDEINAEFDEAHPKILGALLSVVAQGLRRLTTVKVIKLPRMADFAKWILACEESLGWKHGSFIQDFSQARQTMIESALEGEPIYEPLRKLAAEGEWEGTATDLRAKLINLAGLEAANKLPDGWPKSPNALGSKLKRLAPALRTRRIYVKQKQKNTDGYRQWRVTNTTTRYEEGDA